MRTTPPLAVAAAALLAFAPPALAQQPQQAQPPAQQARTVPQSFNQLATEKLPAVVNIAALRNGEASPRLGRRGPGLPFDLPPGLEEFFGGERMPPGMPPPGPARALGSGFVIDPEGYVVTNAHVVDGADEIRVVLQDQTELAATVVGADERTDLALLRVEPDEPLPALEWGDSDGALVGDWVVAIGNPFGLGGTVTAGIVSARARDIQAGPYDEFIQTDASINRGNSGGPLFDVSGRVVGVNTAIFSPTGGSIGIGFAIPSNLAQDVIADLRDDGVVQRGFLGVQIQPVSPDVAEALGLQEPRGALVARVTPESPAAAAGIEVGDVIVGFAGRDIEGPGELSRTVARTDVGTQAQVRVLRDGEERTVTATLAPLDQGTQQAQAAAPGATGRTGPLGLALSRLTPELRSRFGIEQDAEGVVVADVAPDSPAARQGFRPGDVISRVGRQQVEDPQAVADAIEQARRSDRESVLVLRRRGDQQAFVPLEIEEQPQRQGRQQRDRG
jgi:serine protease Do